MGWPSLEINNMGGPVRLLAETMRVYPANAVILAGGQAIPPSEQVYHFTDCEN
jgi:hypothetical protein